MAEKLRARNSVRALIALAATVALSACNSNDLAYFEKGNFLVDNSKSSPLTQGLKSVAHNARAKGFNIVHIGDSHTAADLMTSAIRTKLQQFYGVGAVGWIEPLAVPGQWNSLVTYRPQGAQLINSRTNRNFDYYFGGLVASLKPESKVNYKLNTKVHNNLVYLVARCATYTPCVLDLQTNSTAVAKNNKNDNGILVKTNADGSFEASLSPVGQQDYTVASTGNGVLVRPAAATTSKDSVVIESNNWEQIPLAVSENFTLEAIDNVEVAGLYNAFKRPGVTYSKIGSNGATIAHMQAWNKDWYKELAGLTPDLVILSLGTNESYQDPDKLSQYEEMYRQTIRRIRQSTGAQVLLVTNPDSLNIKVNRNLVNNACDGLQHEGSNRVYNMLKRLSAQEKTLLWDWRAAMGGQCSMLKYIDAGLARKDGVHFTVPTYRRFGEKMAVDLISFLRN